MASDIVIPVSITFPKWTSLAILSASATVVVACSPQAPTFETLDVEARPLNVPARAYGSVAWPRDDRIVLGYLVPDVPEWGLTLVDDDGVELRELTLPDRP